ncbi:MAG: tellurite methyltransferase, partial [Bermanella sp.]
MPSQADQQQRWDTKYAAAVCVSSTAACEVLRSNLHLLPAQGRALDLACGLGANALLLAEQGLRVTARDISSVGLSTLERSAKASGLAIVSEQRDIEHNGVGGGQFDVICVSRYLHRPLCAAISRALNPGGLLFYQTFCEG